MEQFNIQSWLKRGFLLTAILSILVAMGSLPSWATDEILVKNADDSGANSLREAIINANNDAVETPIVFDTSMLSCPITINLLSELPALSGDGDTIDGSACGVTLDGNSAGDDADGLSVQASNITVRGLTIKNFDGHGITVRPPSGGGDVKDVVIGHNVLQDNGNSVRGNNLNVSAGAFGGSTVTFSALDNEISDSGRNGIFVTGSSGSFNVVSAILSDNEVENSGNHGIFVSGGRTVADNNKIDVIVSYNKVKDSTEKGIFVSGGNDGSHEVTSTLSNNEVKNNGDRGIQVSGARPTNTVSVAGITDNESKKNGDDGIFIASNIEGTGATLISGNQAIANKGNGIRLRGTSTGYVLVANEAKGNKEAGIDATGNVDGGGNFAVGNGSCNTPGCF